MNTGYEEIERKNAELYRKLHHRLKKLRKKDIRGSYAYKSGYMDSVQDILDDLKEVYLV